MAAPAGNPGWYQSNIIEIEKYLTGYDNEKHFCDVIESNIDLICKIAFNQQYRCHKREFQFRETQYRGPAVDFLITTDIQTIAIECKNPKNRGHQAAIYQLLKYKVLADCSSIKIDKLVIFTSSYNPRQYDYRIIEHFNLPIEIFFISNEKIFTIQKCQNQN